MDVRVPPLRILLCTAALAGLVALTSGCGGGSNARAAGTKTHPQLEQYTDRYLSFSRPAAWTAYAYRWNNPGLHFNPLVYLSTQPLQNPCTTHGTTTTCGFPVRQLEPGGVLASWEFNEVPLTGPIKLTGKRIQVDGRPAAVQETAGGQCRSIGADRTIETTVELGPDSLIVLTACLRGPGLAEAEKSIDALLASTKFRSE